MQKTALATAILAIFIALTVTPTAQAQYYPVQHRSSYDQVMDRNTGLVDHMFARASAAICRNHRGTGDSVELSQCYGVVTNSSGYVIGRNPNAVVYNQGGYGQPYSGGYGSYGGTPAYEYEQQPQYRTQGSNGDPIPGTPGISVQQGQTVTVRNRASMIWGAVNLGAGVLETVIQERSANRRQKELLAELRHQQGSAPRNEDANPSGPARVCNRSGRTLLVLDAQGNELGELDSGFGLNADPGTRIILEHPDSQCRSLHQEQSGSDINIVCQR